MTSDEILARADDALRRHGLEPRLAQRLRRRKRQSFFGRVQRIAAALGLIAFAAIIWGIVVGPIGIPGVMIVTLAMTLATLALLIFPRVPGTAREPEPTTELALLPLKTEEWLAGQRRLLPAPAIRLVDGIGVQLEQLAPQLQRIDDREPLAAEARRLIADDLPDLIKTYTQIPAALRKPKDGMNPDTQLVDGLAVVKAELDRISQQMAQGDLTALASQGKYLELKYQGGEV
jgi:hypothetical protein